MGLGKFHHDRTPFSRALEIMLRIRGIISFYGQTLLTVWDAIGKFGEMEMIFPLI